MLSEKLTHLRVFQEYLESRGIPPAVRNGKYLTVRGEMLTIVPISFAQQLSVRCFQTKDVVELFEMLDVDGSGSVCCACMC